jgi:5-methylcytosine-specific restriction enzyme A
LAIAPARPCSGSPTCPHVAVYRGRCPQHARGAERQRYNADIRKWYATNEWRILRLIVLGEEPVCMDCRTDPSIDVDHKVPHRGNRALFFDRGNLQGLCKGCHSRKTQRGE